MKRSELQRVDEIVNDWLSYVDKSEKHKEIAKGGESLQGKVADFHGDLPVSGAFKPETIGARVDKCAKIVITKEESRSYAIIMEMPLISRYSVTVWPQIKNKIKPGTRSRYKKRDLFVLLSSLVGEHVDESRYLEEKAKAMRYIIKRDEVGRCYVKAA